MSFLALLDKRYAQRDGARRIGTCSTASPPFSTPRWMIDASFQGTLILYAALLRQGYTPTAILIFKKWLVLRKLLVTRKRLLESASTFDCAS